MTRLDEILVNAKHLLCQTSPSADEDASILLLHVIGKNKAFLYAHPEYTLSADEQSQFQSLIEQRLAGTPVAYLIGFRQFWTLKLKVSEATLIPRADTECLVEVALEHIPQQAQHILDIGTGSGAIALALAKERPQWDIDAVDISEDALNIARENARLNQLTHVQFYCSDLFAKLPVCQYNAIISNPPYIEAGDSHLTQGDLRFEPEMALISGTDGLFHIRHIIEQAQQWLKPQGWLMLEHGWQQALEVQRLMQQHHFNSISSHLDLNGHQRVTIGQA